MTRLALKSFPDIPLEADVITPDQFLGKSLGEIARLPVHSGNRVCELGEFFTISADGSDEITLDGDLARVKGIGTGMRCGKIVIHGNAGMHLGAAMQGGEIDVHGNSGDWTGAEMRGGKIHIRGNAGHGLGGAYRGSQHGMNRGLILIEGNTGNETGALMRRGLIVVAGDAADFTGALAIAGTIIVFGRVGGRPGAGMKRCSIVTGSMPDLLPTYRYDCCYHPVFLRLTLIKLSSNGFPVKKDWISGNFMRYSGDLNTLGKGEILIHDQR